MMNEEEMRARSETDLTPAFATIPDWCRISGMGRTATYQALSRRDLQARKLGKAVLVDVRAGLAWMDTLPMASIHLKGHERQLTT